MNIDFMQSLMCSYFYKNDYENVMKIYYDLQKEIIAKDFENQYIHIEVDSMMFLSDIIQDSQQISELQEKVSLMNERYEKNIKSKTLLGLVIQERKVI